MLNYRSGKEKFKPNELGCLYVSRDNMNDEKRPVIYIGGQMEHRCHVLEQTGFTGDPGHNMFSGNWFYDYPIFGYDKSKVNAKNMTDNFLRALDMSGLQEIDLVTESFGGIIAAYASKDPRIHQIYAVHPPITGTPLADVSKMLKYKELFTKREKLLLLMVKKLIDSSYGFEQENNTGAILTDVDLDKLLVIGSTLDMETEKNNLAKMMYDIILKYTGKKSDGVVIFDEDQFKKFGINYLREPHGLNHFDAGSEENLLAVKELVEGEKDSNALFKYYLESFMLAKTDGDVFAQTLWKKKILSHRIKEDDILSVLKGELDKALISSDELSIDYWISSIKDVITAEMATKSIETPKILSNAPVK